VGYHSVLSPENTAAITDGIRKVYDGPLALARDLTVINVTKENIEVRMAIVDEYVLPSDVTPAYLSASRTAQKEVSQKLLDGKWPGYTPPPMPKRTSD
jgi:ribonuclease Z